MKNYHVTKDGDAWKMKAEGGQRSSIVTETKEQMYDAVRKYSETNPDISVKYHKVDGTIQEERTFPRSSDPRKSKG